MKFFHIFLVVAFIYKGYSQNMVSTEPFPNMEFLECSYAQIRFYPDYFAPNVTKCSDLPTGDKIHNVGGPASFLLGTYTNGEENIRVVFTEGLSDDPEFLFYSSRGEFIAGVSGSKLYLSSNGFFYVVGTANDFFEKKRKYHLSNGKIKEVKQPFYYIGLNTVTQKAVTLYQSKDLKEKVASLPADYNVELLLVEPDYDDHSEVFVLVRTELGLVGWVKVTPYNVDEMEFKGFYYHGD